MSSVRPPDPPAGAAGGSNSSARSRARPSRGLRRACANESQQRPVVGCAARTPAAARGTLGSFRRLAGCLVLSRSRSRGAARVAWGGCIGCCWLARAPAGPGEACSLLLAVLDSDPARPPRPTSKGRRGHAGVLCRRRNGGHAGQVAGPAARVPVCAIASGHWPAPAPRPAIKAGHVTAHQSLPWPRLLARSRAGGAQQDKSRRRRAGRDPSWPWQPSPWGERRGGVTDRPIGSRDGLRSPHPPLPPHPSLAFRKRATVLGA